MTTPIVFIGVEGGIADWTEIGNVHVVIIDWDEVVDNPEYAQSKLDEFASPELSALLSKSSWKTLHESAART